MKVTIPIRIESTPNLREHWAAKAKRAREQFAATFYALKAAKAPTTLPCVVTITRVAPRQLDAHDNLKSGCKHAVDAVAQYLLGGKVKRVDDSDERIEWRYAQRKGGVREYAAEVEFKTYAWEPPAPVETWGGLPT